MPELTVTYRFSDDVKCLADYTAKVDPLTCSLAALKDFDAPQWTSTRFYRCKACVATKATHCPAAMTLAHLSQAFQDMPQTNGTKLNIDVITPERTYSKRTTFEAGFVSLIGFALTFSGCPAFKPFQPMGYFHLPFASLEETLMHATSAHFMRHYFNHQENEISFPKDGGLADMVALYGAIEETNKHLIERLRKAGQTHGQVPLTILQFLSQSAHASFSDGMADLKPYFKQRP